MRGSQLALLLVAACLVAPSALSAHAIQFESPAPRQPVVPQLFCEIVHETAGAQRCDVIGPLSRATEVVVLMAGTAGTVRVLLDDISQPITKQIAFLDCSTIRCARTFEPVQTPEARLRIVSTGAAGHTVGVSVAKDIEEGLRGL